MRFHGARILVSDDDHSITRLCRRVLERQGFAVDTVRSVDEALERARRAAPSLVLLDLKTPVADGLCILRGVRSEPSLADVPVVILSEVTRDEVLREVVAEGVADFVPKPLDADRLLQSVRVALALPPGFRRAFATWRRLRDQHRPLVQLR
jgi:CheY-like chemotaxis protein